ALTWSEEKGEYEFGLQLAANLWQFWYVRGRQRTGRFWFERLLAKADQGTSAAVRARGLNNLGNFALDMSDFNVAQTAYEQSLALRREIGDRLGEGDTLNNLGILSACRSDFALELRYLQQAVALYQTGGHKPRLA
ncbi:tetratricopeptide repeat protein, partial [Klebsiella pneumoniae]|uniref:tetratricopeptide repeat protein n=1 Tax=Klebsiella pneumoniae TaxID=573 RepID=UPI0022AC4BA8